MSKKKTFSAKDAIAMAAINPLAALAHAQNIYNKENYKDLDHFVETAAICQEVLKHLPKNLTAWHFFGMSLLRRNLSKQADEELRKAIEIYPQDIKLICLLAVANTQLERPEESLKFFDMALKIEPQNSDIWYDRGKALHMLGRLEEALESLDKSISINPRKGETWLERGHLAQGLERPIHEIITNFERAADSAPQNFAAWYYLGEALNAGGRSPDALACFDRAIKLQENSENAWLSMGETFKMLGRADLAKQRFEKAIELAPYSSRAWMCLSQSLETEKELLKALEAREKALELEPDNIDITLSLLNLKMRIAKWDDTIAPAQEKEIEQARTNQPTSAFNFISNPLATAGDILKSGQYTSQNLTKLGSVPMQRPPENPVKYPERRIKLAYIGGDFQHHPVSLLMAGVFENHDKTKFDTYAFSTYPQPDNSPMRQRVKKAFNHFFDIHAMSETQAAALIARHQIDILVDLAGHTSYSRMGLMKRRPAPIQITYIGHPATTGVDGIDYIIGDKWVTPIERAQDFSEKIITLPECFQANDSQRTQPSPEETPSRKELGLPEDKIIYCCFNNTYKINPRMFDIWANILKQVPNSVLWLVADHKEAEGNFKEQAQNRGIDPERLIFAPRVAHYAYMARYRAADLFLDTLPFNAGTTASEALWMGVPVLTQAGEPFAGRMAAGLVDSLGMPELIAHTREEYEQKAIQIAQNPQMLKQLKEKLAANTKTAPTFNTERFTKHMEEGYLKAWQLHQEGKAPKHITIAPIPKK